MSEIADKTGAMRDVITYAREEIARLRVAIRKHRDQRGDDRCWLDDQHLYAVLGDEVAGNNELPPKEKFLANCERYYANRCKDGGWRSYQEIEADNAALRTDLSAARTEIARLRAELEPVAKVIKGRDAKPCSECGGTGRVHCRGMTVPWTPCPKGCPRVITTDEQPALNMEGNWA